MRRILCAVLMLVLLVAPTAAFAAAKLDSGLIEDAKQGLSLLSYGEYKKAAKTLNVKSAPSASDLRSFVEDSMPELQTVTVQTDVAVAYLTRSGWRIAVPIEEPSYDGVTAIVLRAKNGKQFDSYKAMAWYDVLDEVSSAQKVVWQNEYDSGDVFIVADT